MNDMCARLPVTIGSCVKQLGSNLEAMGYKNDTLIKRVNEVLEYVAVCYVCKTIKRGV